MNMAIRIDGLLLLGGLLVCGAALCEAQVEEPGAGAPAASVTRPNYVRTGYPPLPLGYLNEREMVLEVFDRFPDADIREVMPFLYSTFPGEMKRFGELALSRSDVASNFLASLVRQALELLDVKRHDPQRFETLLQQRVQERKADDIVRAIRQSEGAAKAKLIKELEEALADVFRIKQEMMHSDLAQMKRELAELSDLMEKRQRNRDSIISRRIRVLTGELEHLEW